MATPPFPPGPLLDQTKMGALMSVGSAALAFGVAAARGRARPAERAPARPGAGS